jgi:subtilisin family serine protease
VLGGSVGTITGDILTAQVPPRQEIDADHIHRDADALGAAYRGRGVVVGIVDSGIDIFHPDFRDPADSTSSRILAIWDQLDDSGPAPIGYPYGTLYTRENIERALRGEADSPLPTKSAMVPTSPPRQRAIARSTRAWHLKPS